MSILEPQALINGRYRVVARIGQGGMGAVYEAIDERLRNRVAIKQTLTTGEQLSRAFEREAQLLANLRHPALPRVIDHFVDPQGQFLVMDYVGGDDLATMLTQRGGPFPLERVLAWADQLLDALEYLHSQDPSIVHRDIKPQNLKLTPKGEIVLLDFGLAKGTVLGGDSTKTASIFAYTPQYAPMEQVQGTGTDGRADIYSLAATIYHLLSGTPPNDVLTRAASVLNRRPDPLEPLARMNREVPLGISEVLQTALAIGADDRFGNVRAFRRALHTAAADGTYSDTGSLGSPIGPAIGATVVQRPTTRPPSQPGGIYGQPTAPLSPPPPAQRPPTQQPPDFANDPYTQARTQPPPGQLVGPGVDEIPSRKNSRGCCLAVAVLFGIALLALGIGVNRLATTVQDFTEEQLPQLMQSPPAIINIEPGFFETMEAIPGELPPGMFETAEALSEQMPEGFLETAQALPGQFPEGFIETAQALPSLLETAQALAEELDLPPEVREAIETNPELIQTILADPSLVQTIIPEQP